MEKLFDDYRLYLSGQSLSENTLTSYVKDLSAFCKYTGAKKASSVIGTTRKTINNYIDSMKELGKANSTISRNIASLRKFFMYLVEIGSIKSNPASSVQVPRVEKKLPEGLTTREVVKLLKQPKCNDLKGYRDKAMLELLYATGIKVSELISLTVRDVDIRGEMLSSGEGKHRRYIPIGKEAAEAVENYLKKARPLLVSETGAKTLFVNCSGAPLTRQGFWKILRKYARSAGIETCINAQTLRNSFAIHLLQNGADIGSVSEMLGHNDVLTTRVYSKVLKDNIKKVYKKAHPRA